MSDKPDALRLADWLDDFPTDYRRAAAAELRRLHTENERIAPLAERVLALKSQRDALLKALRPFAAMNISVGYTYRDVDRARAAIAAVERVRHMQPRVGGGRREDMSEKPEAPHTPAMGLQTIQRRVRATLRKMTPEQARQLSERIRLNDGRGSIMNNAAIRDLTGGFCSQSLNFWVQRQVAVRAGLLPKGAA